MLPVQPFSLVAVWQPSSPCSVGTAPGIPPPGASKFFGQLAARVRLGTGPHRRLIDKTVRSLTAARQAERPPATAGKASKTMTDNILLRAGDARALADDVNRAAAETTDQLASLRGRLATLGDSFQGQSARAFDDRYQEWAESARQLIEALDALGGFLSSAATAIEETDAQLASQLRS